MILALTLMGCEPGRAARLENEVQRLETRAARLRRQVDALHAAKHDALAYWAHRTPDRVPEGYHPNAPLPKPGPTPDVLLLSIDTLRADHLGTYGYDRDTSPFLDGLASTGTRYDAFWSPAPWTLPSHTSMLSGLLPDRHGAFEDDTTIPPDVPLLAETLQRHGYGTVGVVSTLFVSRRFGFERGFDFFEDFSITDKAANNRGTVDAEEVFAVARDWATRQPDGKPLFLFLHSYDVHYTYNAPPPFDTRFDRTARFDDARYRNYHHYLKHPLPADQMAHQVAQYDEEIRYVDAQLKALVEGWRATGRELIVAVTADHGEEFGERGSWGHAHTLYPEQLHVPLIVNGPGIATQVVTERAGTEDLATTLASLVGAQHPAGDGRDRSEQLKHGGTAGTSGLYAETSRFQTTRVRVHADGHDLIVDLDSGREELFDLASDPRARRDLRSTRASTASDLRHRLSERWGTPWKPGSGGQVTIRGQGRVWRDGLVDGPVDQPFMIFPTDARFTWNGAGPYSARLGPLPQSGDLAYAGPDWSGSAVELTEEETRMLEELGYIQD